MPTVADGAEALPVTPHLVSGAGWGCPKGLFIVILFYEQGLCIEDLSLIVSDTKGTWEHMEGRQTFLNIPWTQRPVGRPVHRWGAACWPHCCPHAPNAHACEKLGLQFPWDPHRQTAVPTSQDSSEHTRAEAPGALGAQGGGRRREALAVSL